MRKISFLYLINRYIFLFAILLLSIVFLSRNLTFIDYLNEYWFFILFGFGFCFLWSIFYGSINFFNQSLVYVTNENTILVVKGFFKFTISDYEVENVIITKTSNPKLDLNVYKIKINIKNKEKVCFLYKDFNLEKEKKNNKLWNIISWNKVNVI